MSRFESLEFGGGEPRRPDDKPNRPGGEALKDAPYFLDLADRHFYRMEYEEALRDYSAAANIDPGAAAAWIGQVFCLIELGEYKEAILWHANAVNMVGEKPELLALRALAAARSGDFDRACAYSDSALESGGNSPLAFLVRGEIFLYSGRNGEHCFSQACALGGNDWKIRLLAIRGCVFSKRRKGALFALKLCNETPFRDTGRPEMLLALASVLIALCRCREARRVLADLRSLDPGMTALHQLENKAEKSGFWTWLKSFWR